MSQEPATTAPAVKEPPARKPNFVAWGALGVALIAIVVFASFAAYRAEPDAGVKTLRPVEVGTVTHYGITFDTDAPPEQVAYAVLRAIREDFTAKTPAERAAALDVQFDLAADNVIVRKTPKGFSQEEFLLDVVYHWTPTVSHYAPNLPATWEEAEPRLVLRGPRKADAGEEQADVLLEVQDPDAPGEAAQVVLVVWLVRDKGYWRVTHLGFDSRSSVRSVDASRRHIQTGVAADSP